MGDIDYQALEFEYKAHPAQAPDRHGIVVVGAGPVGLSMALDMAAHGHKVVVIDDDNRLSAGSRAICFAKRTLDIWDRLGVGERMVQKGISWNVGRVYFKDKEVWSFDLLPEPGHRRPAFINLQQYYCEGFLYEQAANNPNIELRWKHRASAVQNHDDHVELTVDTPDGSYTLIADWLVACDGARSPIRKMIGQESRGRIFRDRFLIADIKTQADYPHERWFWFDPPFHPNQSVLLHSQPDNVWRVDFQLGWDADPAEETKPEKVIPRIRALLGPDAQFELEWVSVYTFACERMDKFRHGRLLFAGDAAHRVSPFGARGANSGVQDTDNLAWKLDLVLRGFSPASLLDTYASEREQAADENILCSSRSTDFITPKSEISLLFRNTTLRLANHYEFARKLVNSGRLSLPYSYSDSSLNTADDDEFSATLPLGAVAPGSVAPDGPVSVNGKPGWWLSHLRDGFTVAVFCKTAVPSAAALLELASLQDLSVRVNIVLVLHRNLAASAPPGFLAVIDHDAILDRRYDVRDGACYLLRPDQHIAARWRHVNTPQILAALQRATCTLQAVTQ
ncbi:FAD-dependent oxidoreductase [Pollutimonas subterranea]|uniref:FAD-dependent oxidoreductase n=1 Tax=Pollutimonas subterranea TaxID=2045210 RepID=A0A2N4U4T0_9BURK|nr:FAD-dependent oxidoreductase [Pollutimonas subterranea]PLC50016.1 FAD-dependent oxidoreductase [Pollutimonas subterranea]